MTFDTHSKQGGVSAHVLVHISVIGRFAYSECMILSAVQMGHSLANSSSLLPLNDRDSREVGRLKSLNRRLFTSTWAASSVSGAAAIVLLIGLSGLIVVLGKISRSSLKHLSQQPRMAFRMAAVTQGPKIITITITAIRALRDNLAFVVVPGLH